MDRQKRETFNRPIDVVGRQPSRNKLYLDGMLRSGGQPANDRSNVVANSQPSINTPPRQAGIEPPNRFSAPRDETVRGQVRGRSFIGANLPPGGTFTRPINNLPPKKRSWKKRVLLTIAIILILIIGAGTWFGLGILGKIDKVVHGNVFSDVGALFSTTRLKGEAQGRVNILLAGYQGTNSDEGPLTDSIMVISINTNNDQAFTVSIPRDIWINLPGLGYNKINAANTDTNFHQSGYFSGGMGELQKVIQKDFGISLDYYALIDYTAFKDAVNAVGGIRVDIQSSDPRGLYDPNVDKAHGGPLKLPNGWVNLNGNQALALALARGDSPYAYGFPLSDINRTQHQRQMLIALEQKALSAGVLGSPVKISNLFSALSNNVQTNLSLADVIRLAQIAKKINLSNIQSYGLSYGGSQPLLTTYVTSNGQDALIPKAGLNNYSQIQQYFVRLMSTNPIVQEAPTITILNASSNPNLAQTVSQTLSAKGFTVLSTASTYQQSGSIIVDNTNGQKPSSAALLTKLYPKAPVVNSTSNATEAQLASGYSANFVMVLGQNQGQ